MGIVKAFKKEELNMMSRFWHCFQSVGYVGHIWSCQGWGVYTLWVSWILGLISYLFFVRLFLILPLAG